MRVERRTCDVAVIGAGPGGLTAAVAAARQGAKVLLVERNGYLGGGLALGIPILGFLDSRGRKVASGLGEQVVDRLTAAGGSYGITVCPHHNSVVTVHPDLLKIVAIDLCTEAGIEVVMHCETVDVDVTNGAITAVSVQGKGTRIDIGAKVVVDGTGDGDVGYLAGAAFEKGHPGSGGLQPPTVLFSLGNVKLERLWDYLDAHPEDHVDPVEWFRTEPSHVFVGLKTLYKRLKERGERPVEMPALICVNTVNEGQVIINGMRLHGTDAADLASLTRAEMEGHRQVRALIGMLRKHVPGFEDCRLVTIFPTLGVRETRRLLGRKHLTVDRALAYDIPEDTIALAAYMIDIHSPTDDTSRFTKLEGPFGIPYLTLVSRSLSNLMMVGRCISVDYEVYGSTRVMATCMAVGEAAGVGAAIAAASGIAPAEVPHGEVRKRLIAAGAILAV